MLFLMCAIALLVAIFLIDSLFGARSKSIKGRHVVVTGGSSGIGKAMAVQAARLGANVTIVARNVDRMEAAMAEIVAARLSPAQKVRCLSLDVSDGDEVDKRLGELDTETSPVFMLVNCAGTAVCAKVEDTPFVDVRRMMDVNYYGTYYAVRAIVQGMKRRGEGAIVLTGSQASLLGIFGYSAYAASKFAVRGLAEALDMEVRAYKVSVTLALPPDTDTPGFENENRSKPEVTRLISETAGVFKSDEVARKIMKDALAGNFLSRVGFESFLLTTLCVGMAPCSSVFEAVYQCCLLGPFRLIGCVYLAYFHGIIRRCVAVEDECKKTS